MSPAPETQPSLLVRLKNRADQAAWDEFAQFYTPVVYRLGLGRGLQHADAEDLVQQVLSAVAKSINRWQTDPARGQFRTWLHRVAQNLIINALTRKKPDVGSGDSRILERLHEQASHDGPTSDLVRIEFRREVFRWAADQIRDEFQALTWEAFWLTAVEDQGIAETAQRLRMSQGAVYAARSRVMRRLKQKVGEFEDEQRAED